MVASIEVGMIFYDDQEGRYLTAESQHSSDTWMCAVEELNDNGDYEEVRSQLFRECEIRSMKYVEVY